MPHTVQVWIKDDGEEKLRKLIKFHKHEAEVNERENIERAKRTANRRIRNRLLKTIGKSAKINESYILREALDCYWNEKCSEVLDYEKQNRD